MRLKISLNRMNSIVTDMTSKAKVCRICLLGNIKGVISLFTVYNGSDRIYSKVMEVANIQISVQDGLPTWICYSCLVHLETSYQFKMQAEKSDQLLRKQLEITNTEETEKFVDDGENPLQEQTEIQGHFMSEVTEGDGSEIQDGIKITNVVSQAQPELLDVDECPSENRLADLSDNDARYIPTPACICTEGQDDAQRNACLKMSSDRASDEDVNNCINNKTCQVEETAVDDLFVSKDCINRIIDYIERNEQWSTSVYSCTQCGDCFADSQVVTQLAQKTKKEFDCYICNKSFMFRTSLNAHLSMHKGVEPYKCSICEYTSNASNPANRNRNILRHMLIHAENKPFKCDICSKTFATEQQLINHKEIHSEVKSYKCDQCEKAFINKKGLRNHKLVHLDFKLKSKKNCECYICDQVFPCEETTKAHLRTHSGVRPYQCNFCSYATFINGNIKRHMLTHTEDKPFTCGVCAKSFTSQYNLNKHVLTHSSIKPYKCNQCERSFVNEVGLKYHQVDHLNEAKFKCKQCGKGFKCRSSLEAHEQSHSGPVKCGVCSKEFVSRTGLVAHNKVHHSGLEPQYICEVCGKGFMLRSLLNSHKLVHVVGSSLECDICSKKFPHKRALKVHKSYVHFNKMHQCHLCGKNFKYSSSLRIHTRTSHSDAEKYNCTVCDATFTQKSALNTHTKILHTGIEPHSCESCGQTFKWKQTFDKHRLKCGEKE